MAKSGSGRPTPLSPKQREALRLLEKLAKTIGLKVSVSSSLRFQGLKLKGGHCLFKEAKWIVLDRTQSFDNLLEIYRQVLTSADLEKLPSKEAEFLATYLKPL